MTAAAPTASTILSATTPRPSRPYWALGALALIVGLIVMAGSWVYLGPRAVPETYFTVTAPPGAQTMTSPFWGYPSSDWFATTRQDVVQQLGDTPYGSITGPFTTFGLSEGPGDQFGDAIRAGALAALIAYLLLGLLGFSARFRRFEEPIGRAGAAFANRFGGTKRARAWSLHLVVAGAIVSGLVAWVLVSALDAVVANTWSFDTPPLWAIIGASVLFAVVSIGVVAAFALVLRRIRVSEGVGSFLLGYGGLLAAAVVLLLLLLGAASVADPEISSTGQVLPAARLVDIAAQFLADPSSVVGVGVLTLICAIPTVGSILVYRDYRRRLAGPTEGLVIEATA
jgi:hypothetical protein